MIGRLSGVVDYKGTDHVLIDVRGVGYVVHVSDSVLARLPGAGEAVALYTDMIVRQDLVQLIGFLTLAEKEWHRLLVGVQGVGAKASLSILGTLGADGLSRAIALGDWSSVARAKGVGPKTAQRVVLDLKDRAPSVMAMAGRAAMEGVAAEVTHDAAPARRTRRPAAPDPAATAAADALSALVNLGWGPSDAAAAVAEAQGAAPDIPTPDLIRAALKRLAPR
ncbi:MAG: Holliday junction branch migration protein RuvA [Rubellimicrobium sp.]|nr:Holliday junction branch migration protein RuvA [Rubellimicrobium sp.]